jgi:hypothetical protein
MDSRCKRLIEIGDGLFARKRPWDELCQQLAENFYPMRADFTRSFTLGEDFSENLMESYPVQARETLANMISAMLRQNDWFAVRTGYEEIDDEPVVARWFEDKTKVFRRQIYDRRANFVRAANNGDHDWVTFGNPVFSVEESFSRDHILFRDWHPRDCAWMENAAGRIDHVQRHMPYTARNLVKRWPKTAHANVRTLAEREPARTIKLRHIVMPAEDYYDDRKARRASREKPFVSIYIDCDNEVILSEGPLPVFSYVIPRWRTLPGFACGFSPATINALPDARMIQQMASIILEQGEKAIEPPIAARGEAFREWNLYAGGITYADLESDQSLRDAFQVMNEGGDIALGLDMKQDVRALIAESFLLNKLMLPSGKDMTAFETNARLEEFRRAALPFLGPIESEYHLPLLDTAFQICLRNGVFGPAEDMPDELSGADVTFSFDSPLNAAEGRKNVVAFQEAIQIIAGAAQIDNSVPAAFDFRKMTKDAVKGAGAREDWKLSEEAAAAAEGQADQVAGLTQAATALRGGAAVAGDVANATIALRQAGLV